MRRSLHHGQDERNRKPDADNRRRNDPPSSGFLINREKADELVMMLRQMEGMAYVVMCEAEANVFGAATEAVFSMASRARETFADALSVQ